MTKDVKTVGEDLPLVDAYRLFHDYEIRHLPVVDGDQLIGIISIRDIGKIIVNRLRRGECEDLGIVKDVMARDVKTIGPNDDLERAALLLYNEKISALPVVERGRALVGILTTQDLLEVLVCELEWTKRKTPGK
jgi:acetoin utilization protein AcuB